VSVSCVIKLMRRWRENGPVDPGQMDGWKDYALADHEAVGRALIAERPDLTLEEPSRGAGVAGLAPSPQRNRGRARRG